MSVHLEARPGDLAPVVLLPGDPLRAQFIAERYLSGAVCTNQVRGALGFTGTFQGKRLSVQSTGMGMPSASIYVHELLAEHGARVLLRVGTCGALQASVSVRDLILAIGASTDSAMNRHTFGGRDFAPTASFDLLRRAHEIAVARGLPVQVGSVVTCDRFYAEDDEWWAVWARHGVLAAEMETAAIYTLAARAGVRALAILAVSDHLTTGEHTSAEERQTSFTHLIEVALEVAASFV